MVKAPMEGSMSKEYVEREVISEGIRKYYYKNPPNSSYQEGFDCGLDKAQRVILDAPAADVVEVVRCRECKYWGDEAGELQRSDGVLFARCKVHNYLLDGRHTGWCPTENDFCSYGERKEGADNEP